MLERKPWDRNTPMAVAPTRFAKQWREGKSIEQIVVGALSKVMNNPDAMCTEGDRMMQKRSCAPIFNRSNPLAEGSD